MTFAEYIWMDGTLPVSQLRSKTRFVELPDRNPTPSDLPTWSFDGSSTNQADGHDSDCVLEPVCVVNDPSHEDRILVLCEVFDAKGVPCRTNSRARLRKILELGGGSLDAWIGFEQEYTLFADGRPLGWPQQGDPDPQGPYYCSVGADRAFGREIANKHADLCTYAGLMYYGLNAEVMPGQWEFQIGYRGVRSDNPSLLNTCDHLWIARWLLHRVAEKEGVTVSFENKPMKGDWNGAGMHTNYSTIATRNPSSGKDAIMYAIDRLGERHADHVGIYGHNLHERLTGDHETCSIDEFRSGTSDRGASIRIPISVQSDGHGYFEDRRPGANADPYLVAARITATVAGADDSILEPYTRPFSKSMGAAA